MEADAPVDIDIITAGVDELGENDQFAVAQGAGQERDVEGVQRHLEVLDYNGGDRVGAESRFGGAAAHRALRDAARLERARG